MRAISAADAISPAVERTKQLLFRPFSWGTFLKLGLVALITEGLGSNLRSSTPRGGGGSGLPQAMPHLPHGRVLPGASCKKTIHFSARQLRDVPHAKTGR